MTDLLGVLFGVAIVVVLLLGMVLVAAFIDGGPDD